MTFSKYDISLIRDQNFESPYQTKSYIHINGGLKPNGIANPLFIYIHEFILSVSIQSGQTNWGKRDLSPISKFKDLSYCQMFVEQE